MNTLVTTAMLVELLFGLGLIAVPGVFADAFGGGGAALETTLLRLLGSALLGFAVLLWFGRTSGVPAVHRTVLASMFVYWITSSALLLFDQLFGEGGRLLWGITALHFVFAIAFGHSLFAV